MVRNFRIPPINDDLDLICCDRLLGVKPHRGGKEASMSDKTKFAMVAKNLGDLEQLLIESDGEHTPEIQSRLREVLVSVDTSASMINRCEVNAKHFREEARKRAAIARGFEKSESYIREMIKDDMIAHGQTELVGTEIRFMITNSKSKLVIDEAELDSEYQMHVLQPDRKRIEEDLALGVPVKGAHLEEVKALRSYLNKRGGW